MIELTGIVSKEGTAKIFKRGLLDEWFSKHAGKYFTIKVEKKRKRRSNDQNAYYWVVVIPMVRDRLFQLGNEFSLEDTHEALKAKFNTTEIQNEEHVVDEFVASTSDLTTVQFMEYLDKIQRWANQFLGIVIPNPNEELKINFD